LNPGISVLLQKFVKCDKKEEIPLDIMALFTTKKAGQLTGKGDYIIKYEIVGRAKEIKKLEDIFASKDAEFLAIYGRRRVGKTYLVRQFFKAKPVTYFEVTGLNGIFVCLEC
jgi:hypothetical protein